MARVQGVNGDGEVLTSMYVKKAEDYSLHFGDEKSLCRQEFAEEADINILMSRFEKTGMLPSNVRGPGNYLDVSEMPDLQEAMRMIAEATNSFMTLPAVARREFDNDPAKFVTFAQDAANIDRLREWGLAAPLPVEPPPTRVEVVNPPSADGK